MVPFQDRMQRALHLSNCGKSASTMPRRGRSWRDTAASAATNPCSGTPCRPWKNPFVEQGTFGDREHTVDISVIALPGLTVAGIAAHAGLGAELARSQRKRSPTRQCTPKTRKEVDFRTGRKT